MAISPLPSIVVLPPAATPMLAAPDRNASVPVLSIVPALKSSPSPAPRSGVPLNCALPSLTNVPIEVSPLPGSTEGMNVMVAEVLAVLPFCSVPVPSMMP